MKRIGVIGWGYWGRNYAKYFQPKIGAELTHVCDLRRDMIIDAKMAYHNITVTDSLNDMITAKLDGIIVASPASLHYRIAKSLLSAGIPLLIEKPLTDSTKTAQELVEVAHKNKTKVLVGHTFLYNQSVIYLKNAVQAGSFGKLYYLEFRRQSYGPIRDDVNIIWDFAPHDIAITNYLLNNKYPMSVMASAGVFSRNNKADIAVIVMRYQENIVVNINVAWLYPIKIRSLTLLGDKKMAVFEDTNSTTPVIIYDTSVTYPKEEEPSGASLRLGDIYIPRIPVIDPLGEQLRHFIAYLNEREKPISPIEDGLKVVKIIEALQESLRTGCEIKLRL